MSPISVLRAPSVPPMKFVQGFVQEEKSPDHWYFFAHSFRTESSNESTNPYPSSESLCYFEDDMSQSNNLSSSESSYDEISLGDEHLIYHVPNLIESTINDEAKKIQLKISKIQEKLGHFKADKDSWFKSQRNDINNLVQNLEELVVKFDQLFTKIPKPINTQLSMIFRNTFHNIAALNHSILNIMNNSKSKIKIVNIIKAIKNKNNLTILLKNSPKIQIFNHLHYTEYLHNKFCRGEIPLSDYSKISRKLSEIIEEFSRFKKDTKFNDISTMFQTIVKINYFLKKSKNPIDLSLLTKENNIKKFNLKEKILTPCLHFVKKTLKKLKKEEIEEKKYEKLANRISLILHELSKVKEDNEKNYGKKSIKIILKINEFLLKKEIGIDLKPILKANIIHKFSLENHISEIIQGDIFFYYCNELKKLVSNFQKSGKNINDIAASDFIVMSENYAINIIKEFIEHKDISNHNEINKKIFSHLAILSYSAMAFDSILDDSYRENVLNKIFPKYKFILPKKRYEPKHSDPYLMLITKPNFVFNIGALAHKFLKEANKLKLIQLEINPLLDLKKNELNHLKNFFENECNWKLSCFEEWIQCREKMTKKP